MNIGEERGEKEEKNGQAGMTGADAASSSGTGTGPAVAASTTGAGASSKLGAGEGTDSNTSLRVCMHVLPKVDEALVLSKLFLQRIVTEAISRKRGESVVSIINALVHENEYLSQTMISYVIMGIDDLPCDRIRPFFRVLMGLVLLRDSLQSKRVDWILTSLLASMVRPLG